MSTPEEFMAAAVTGPHPGTASATDTRAPQRLTGTIGEDHPAIPLTVGQFATIINGAQPIRFRLHPEVGLADAVGATDPIIPAYGTYPWLVEAETCVPYVQSEDGTTEFECWVHRSSR